MNELCSLYAFMVQTLHNGETYLHLVINKTVGYLFDFYTTDQRLQN